jgi:hypothetical protein
MRFLLLLAAIGVGAFVFWRMAKGRPALPGGRRTAADGAWAVVCLVMLMAAAYLAHRLGIFALPLVVLAFLPIGVAMRWLLIKTQGSRERRNGVAEALPAHPLARYTVPLLALSAVAVAAIGVLVGTLIGPN